MEQFALEPQDEVWVYTDKDSSRSNWLRGVITAVQNSSVDVRVTRGQVKEEMKGIPWDQIIKYQSLAERGIPDALDASPEQFGEVFMVENLRVRHSSALPSMKAGPFLVTLRGDCVQGLDKDPSLFARPKNEERPDVAQTARSIYEKCIADGAAKTIICTGVSGSGKSWACKESLRTLSECGIRGAISSQVVKENIEAAMTVLDAFGNAATAMNPDSSRSTRSYSLYYDIKGSLVGAKLLSLHLDLGRLTRKPVGEGPFHILLQLCHGAWASERDKFQLRTMNEYKLLENSPRSPVTMKEHSAAYSNTRDALSKLGFSMAEQEHVMQLVAGMLTLGNVLFTGAQCEPYNKEMFEQAALLLGVPHDEFLSAFAEQKVNYDGRTMVKKRRPESASALVPQMLEFLYGSLYDFLLDKINAALQPYSQPGNLINVVDPSGFERAAANTFDQLCVNYLDERLKAALIRRLFCLDLGASNESLEQEQLMMYLEQSQKSKAEVEKDLLPDQLTIQLFDGPGGLLSVFDAETKAPNGSAASMASKIFASKEPAAVQLLSRPDPAVEQNGLYCIKHSMGFVTYHETDALDPNFRTMPSSLRKVLQQSNLPCMPKIVELGNSELDNGTSTVIHELGSKLQAWVTGLDQLASLSQSNGYITVICCIRPNLTPKPDVFDASAVLQQLRAWQVCQAVHFRQIFSDNVVSTPVFTSKWTSMDSHMQNEAKQSAMVSAFSTQCPALEKMSSSQNNISKWLQNVDQTRAALKIQSAYRRWLVRLKYRRLGTLFEKIQQEVRRMIILERYGQDLMHDQQQIKQQQIAESVSRDVADREARKHEQLVQSPDFLSPAEQNARKVRDITAHIAAQKEQGLLHSQRRIQEDDQNSPTLERQLTAHDSPEESEYGGYDLDFDDQEQFAHVYMKEQPFSGSSQLAQALKQSIGADLRAVDKEGMPALHKTHRACEGDYYVPKPEVVSNENDKERAERLIRRGTPVSQIEEGADKKTDPDKFLNGICRHVPAPTRIGVNCPTDLVPSDLTACVERFRINHPKEDWAPAEPSRAPLGLQPTRQQQEEVDALGRPPGCVQIAAEMWGRDHASSEQAPSSPSKIGPGGTYATRYRHKYKFRQNLDQPQFGYESGDSSFSEDSIESDDSEFEDEDEP